MEYAKVVQHSNPLISVTLATYNGDKHLEEQLDSLLSQTFTNFEIIVGDDCSTDKTLSILLHYSEKDSRINVIQNEQRLGLQKNFETLMRRARGQFIAPCDQDDIWHPQKLERLLKLIECTGCSLVYCNSEIFRLTAGDVGKTVFVRNPPISGSDIREFAFKNSVSGHASLMTRDVVEKAIPFPEAIFYDWWLAAVATTLKGVAFTTDTLVDFRQHSSNVTNRLPREKKKRWRDAGRIWRQIRGNRQEKLKSMEASLKALLTIEGNQHRSELESLLQLVQDTLARRTTLRLFSTLYRDRVIYFGERFKDTFNGALRLRRMLR